MCQLFGMNCNTPASITFSFTGLCARGGRTGNHVDGWGVGFYQPSGSRVFHDDQPASESPLASFLRDHPIKSKTVLAHVRKATQGARLLSNCHPFQREWHGKPWLFATNGDLRDFHPELTGPYQPIGNTDSERAFCWLMQELRTRFAGHRGPVSWEALAPEIADIAEGVARHGNFNFLLSNGDALYAHCSTKLYALERRFPFPTATLVDCDMSLDLSQLNGPGDHMALIATEPLTSTEPWVPFATGEMTVFVAGMPVWNRINPAVRAFPMPDERALPAANIEAAGVVLAAALPPPFSATPPLAYQA